jgi:MFS family permease
LTRINDSETLSSTVGTGRLKPAAGTNEVPDMTAIPFYNGMAQGPRGHAGHAVSPGDIAIGVIIGRTSEFFDFFVYAIASVLVFPKVFSLRSPASGDAVVVLAVCAGLSGPSGGVGGVHGRRPMLGREAKLTIALFLLGGSTAAIAFLPGYETLGARAIWLLALFRLGQGFALGGTWDGLASLLALNAPENRRGWYAMIPQLGAPLG